MPLDLDLVLDWTLFHCNLIGSHAVGKKSTLGLDFVLDWTLFHVVEVSLIGTHAVGQDQGSVTWRLSPVEGEQETLGIHLEFD